MTPSLSRVAALMISTSRDVLRRPGGVVALLVTSTLLILLPRLARRALDDGAGLAVELVLSTLTLHGVLLAGFVSVHTGSTGSALGPVPEFLATPLRWSEYVAGRVMGVVLATHVHVAVLGLIAFLAIVAGSPDAAPTLAVVAGGAVSVSVQITLFAAAGLCCGAFLGPQMGSVAAAAFFVAARILVPTIVESGSPLSILIPDPSRADIARAIAFENPIGAGAWSLTIIACALQAIGLLCAAHWRLAGGRPAAAPDTAS